MTDTARVKDTLARFGLKPNRALGQNFLANPAKAEAIAQAACEGGLPVLEIGPGLGALTEPLLCRAPKVCAVEIDRAMADALRALFAGHTNLCLIHQDFLKADLPAIYAELGGPFAVAANLPYYVTTPICLRLLSSGLPIPRLVLMAQQEAAERFFARPSSRQYGPLSVLAQHYYEPRPLMELSPADYYPQPDVSSAVALFIRRDTALIPGFLDFLQQAFAQRRKTLYNNLKGIQGAAEALERCHISPSARAESLEPAALAALAAAVGISVDLPGALPPNPRPLL